LSESPCDRKALLFSARQLSWPPLFQPVKADWFDEFLCFSAIDPNGATDEADMVDCREMWPKRQILKYKSNISLVRRHIDPLLSREEQALPDSDCSRSWWNQAGDCIQERGLSCTAWSPQDRALARSEFGIASIENETAISLYNKIADDQIRHVASASTEGLDQ
jgi:hypothetical protein